MSNEPTCPSCGVPYDKNLGLVGTCAALQRARNERDEATKFYTSFTDEIKTLKIKWQGAEDELKDTTRRFWKTIDNAEVMEKERDAAQAALREILSRYRNCAERHSEPEVWKRWCDAANISEK